MSASILIGVALSAISSGSVAGASITAQNWSAPVAVAAADSGLNSVSCPDANDCTAVGVRVAASGDKPIVETEAGGVWAPSVTKVDAPLAAALAGVSCSDATDCTAVGETDAGAPIYITESGGTWGPATDFSGFTGAAVVTGVSCVDATDCTAVGYTGSEDPFYVTETGGTWGSPTVVTPAGEGAVFASVSCSDATDCTAVGYDVDPPTYTARPFYTTESGGTWGSGIVVAGPGTEGAFYGVSCSDASDCTAVGGAGADVGSGVYTGAIAATESSGTWGNFTVIPKPNDVAAGHLDSVSCWSATNCTAVGDNGDRPVFATDSSGTWAPLIRNEPVATAVVDVSCSGAFVCAAAGYGHPALHKYDAMYVTESPTPA
jgi:hypothetical protein